MKRIVVTVVVAIEFALSTAVLTQNQRQPIVWIDPSAQGASYLQAAV